MTAPVRFLPCLVFALSIGCVFVPVRLEPGQAVSLRLAVRPGAEQLIKLEASGVGAAGAEVTLAVGDLRMAPVYLAPPMGDVGAETSTRGRPSVFSGGLGFFGGPKKLHATWLLSGTWPIARGAPVKISNYGPSSLTLRGVGVRRGRSRELIERASREAPFPPLGWIDLEETIARESLAGIGNRLAAEQMPSLAAWLTERRRRSAFESIEGLPVPLRMSRRIVGDVEVRACRIGGRGAVVGLSRRDRSRWHAVGPGWIPRPSEARWDILPEGRFLPRSFRVSGPLLALGAYLAPVGGAEGATASLEARLYRLDSPVPVATAEWPNLDPRGQWVELKPEEPGPPGVYVIEFRVTGGAVAWLVWNRERSRIAGTDLTEPIETLVVHEASEQADYAHPLTVAVRLVGRADRVQRFAGDSSRAMETEASYERGEIAFEAELLPGQTELFFARDYRP